LHAVIEEAFALAVSMRLRDVYLPNIQMQLEYNVPGSVEWMVHAVCDILDRVRLEFNITGKCTSCMSRMSHNVIASRCASLLIASCALPWHSTT
jgi:hypothetical protein